MRVQTSAGEVELTAEMVRRGMVFKHSGGVHVAGSALAGEWWLNMNGVAFVPLDDYPLLGCDPLLAARKDVERYGVAPGIEAGAHGFELAPVLTVDGHRCPASLWVNVAVHADSPRGPTQTTVDISGEVADGDRFAARVESACRDGSVVVVGVALGDGKSTTLQGIVCSFGMAGRRLTAKLVCAPVRAKSAAPLSEAFFDTSCASMTPEAKRRAAEAPLVALVAAVPEGLDPIGWRAAVLAFVENAPQDKAVRECALSHVNEAGAVIEGFVLDGAEPTAIRPHPDDRVTFTAATMWAVCDAYARAVAPQGPRPAPERRKSPGLPLDVDAELAGLDARAGR